ncbi:nitroreductase family protein [Cetobacterium sp. SF1]|uniref:nitroreductase family protein n=1 Tax=Cetobacterium sp. SF1 TaxID=3417654 RepID=UPI003CF77A99
MDFFSRRTIRKYRNVKVEKFKINEIIRTALVSPSGRNQKPYEFIIVENDETLEKLSMVKSSGADMVKDAPLAIVVLGKYEHSNTWMEDCSIASTMIQLKSYELGLGTCWVQIYGRSSATGESSEHLVRELLNIPEEYKVLNIITIGYPGESKRSYAEEDMDLSKVHYEKY